LANDELASFYSKLNRYSEALPLYKHAADFATRSGAKDELAEALNGLGLVYTSRSELDNARVCLVEALAIARAWPHRMRLITTAMYRII
jgi:hypothetical protein